MKILSENNDVYLATIYYPGEDDQLLNDISMYCRAVHGIPYWRFGNNQAEIRRWLNNVPIDIVHYEWADALKNYDPTAGRIQIFTYMEAVSLRLLMDMEKLPPLSTTWLDSLYPQQTYMVLNHGVNLDEFSLPDVKPEPKTLTFVGNFGHYPNVDAMTWFFSQVWNEILKEEPNTRIYLVGPNPPETLVRLADGKQIIVTGGVPDVRPYIQKATLCIAPLISGAGLRGKVIEYAALQRTFVASSIATEDLIYRHEIEYLQANTAREFARNVIRLLQDGTLARELANSAYTATQQHYDTRRLVSFLLRLYNYLELKQPPA
jgi:glycosyltransferase involved in cell wall biosynthesis